MILATMSPKVLNVEKLEKKFASLTRSRESIQGLSTWIIRHKDFYKEIVNQWLDALTRDFNALTMFYVANDVIQNCGRKKAPEFREAFETVLEKAVALEKVKDIKTEVTRMLTLWHERSIYDDEFFKKLEDKLNAEVEESESENEDDVSEADVIANFKLENVINSLKKLKTLEDELLDKESFLEDIEEPGMCNIDNLIVKMDSQKELRKFDKFQKLVEDCISLTDKVIAAKKAVLINLKYSNIFYNAQMEDAKKVAHAYRIYGKKVKIVEKALSEKILTLPEPPSPVEDSNPSSCDEINSSQDSIAATEVSEDDKNTPEDNCFEMSISPKEFESETKEDTLDDACKTVTNEIVSPDHSTVIDTEKIMIDPEKIPQTFLVTESEVKDNLIKINESVSEVPEQSVVMKTPDGELQSLPDVENIDFLLEKAYDDQKKENKLSFKRKIDNLLKLKQAKTCKLMDSEVSGNNNTISTSHILSESAVPVQTETQLPTSLESISKEQKPAENQSNVVESLLSKESISKEQKPVENQSNVVESLLSKEESNLATKSTFESEKVILQNSISVDPKSMDVINKVSPEPDVTIDTQIICDTQNESDCKDSKSSKADHSVENVDMHLSNKNESKSISPSTSLTFQTLPDIPTELLKNILDKHRINMYTTSADDLSASISILNSVTDHKDQASDNQNLETESSGKNINLGNNNNTEAQKISVGENISDESIKDSLSITASQEKTENVTNKAEIESTLLLDNLQNILELFTKKEIPLKELKCSETLSPLASMPLTNSLRIFSCIMQSCNKNEPSSSAELSNNLLSDQPAKEFKNETKLTDSIDYSVIEKSTSLSLGTTNGDLKKNYSADSKNDNLEIMDMEVDSDDENL